MDILEEFCYKHRKLFDQNFEFLLSDLCFTNPQDHKWFAYSYDLCTSTGETVGYSIGRYGLRKDDFILAFKSEFVNDNIIDIHVSKDSPNMVNVRWNDTQIGVLEADTAFINETMAPRVKEWKIHLKDYKNWAKIKRGMVVNHSNLRIEVNDPWDFVKLGLARNLDFPLSWIGIKKILNGTYFEPDFVLKGIDLSEYSKVQKELLFSIIVFFRIMVFRLEFGVNA